MPGNSQLEDEIELLLARDADVPPATAKRLAELFVRGNGSQAIGGGLGSGTPSTGGGGGVNNINTVAVNLTSMPGYDGTLDGLETSEGMGMAQVTATGV